MVLIEDESMLRRGLLETTPWAEHGFAPVGDAADAVEGERLILEKRPELVITDIRLPQVSGLDLIERLNDRIVCDYIIISGYDTFDYARRAIFLGVKAYLLKPIDDAELFSALDRVRAGIERRKAIEATLSQSAAQPEAPQPGKSLGDRYLDAAMAYMGEHLQGNITMRSVAEALCISESYLSKLFKRKTGRSFLDALTRLRMQEAARLLEGSDMKVYEIADRLGYRDVEHFSGLFRKFTGVNPSEYKRQG